MFKQTQNDYAPHSTGVYLDLDDTNSLASGMSRQPIIVNDLDINNKSIKAKLSELIYTYYDDSVVETIPSCQCPRDAHYGLRGARHKGKICPICKSEVVTVIGSDLESHVWIRAPKGVDRLMTPIGWYHLCNAFDIKSCKIIQWLVNPNYTSTIKDKKIVNLLASFKEKFPKFERSMNFFYRNFDAIIDHLLESAVLRSGYSSATYDEVTAYIALYKDKIFTKYLPLPSRMIFIMEANAKRAQADPELFSLLDAVNCIAGKECADAIPLQPKRANSIAVNIQMKLEEHYGPVIKYKLGKKQGIYRQNVFGRRCHLTSRTVLSSISGKHDYRLLYIPWGVAMELFRYRIKSYLVSEKGMLMNEADRHITQHFLKYCPVIDEFFEIITSKNKIQMYSGETQTNQRNPTLTRAGIQYFGIGGVHKNPNNHTTSQSPLTFSGPNADLDGDALNQETAPDGLTKELYSRLAPHLAICDLNRPFRYNKNINLPNPVIATMVNYINAGALKRRRG